MKNIDYKTLSGDPSAGQVYIKKWWLSDADEMAQCIATIVKQISEYDSRRQTQYQISTRLYGNMNLMGLNGLSYSKIASVQNSQKDRVSYNVVQSAIDTVTAKIAKNKPKPLFLTSGGDWKMQRKAKKCDKFIDGIFYENKYHSLAVDIFRDAAVFGDGFIHVFPLHGRVKCERVIPSELYVDWMESFYGHPRQLHRVKNIDREVLKDLFPSKKRQITETTSASADLIGAYQNVADEVTVVESWHLPSGPDAKDGLHTISLYNEMLFKEEWKKDYFPFANFKWSKRMYGYWGQGAAEQIQNLQLEINKILFIIQRSMHLAGSFKVLMEMSSKIVKEHINNDIGAIVMYQGNPPQYIVPPVVPVEYYQHLQTLKQSAFEQVGVSMLSAASVKPEGLNSGKALREYNDIESDRFMTIGQEYENLSLQTAKLCIATAKELFEDDKKFSVQVPGKKFIETIDWKDIDLEDDEYVMKIFPVSSLPQDPSGRLQTIQEYVQAGFITPRAARRLLDFPDLEQVEDLQNSEEDYLNMILEKIVDEGIYTAPEPQDDPQLARELALEYYSQGKLNNLEEDKLDLLRTFIKQLDVFNAQAQQALAAQAQAMQPQAQAMPQPQSNMIPNVPGVSA